MASLESNSNSKPHQSFRMWVEENYATGMDGSGNKQQYIPYAKLREYADHERVGAFLGTEDKEVDIRKLREDYLLIFFILVYMSAPSKKLTTYFLYFYHQEYRDSQLPLPKPPDQGSPPSSGGHSPFPHTSDGITAWREFYEQQWRFIPLCIKDNHGNRIERANKRNPPDPRHIIPVTFEEELQSKNGGSARLLKVRPQESSGLPSTTSIVMKEYCKSDAEYEFKQERQTYTTINNITESQHIIDKYFLRYYGSFMQANKCVILVEYADKKTLLDLFRGNQYLPRVESEACALWESLSMLCNGLEIIHRRGKNNWVIHQDIKPDNVFAFSNPEQPGQLIFKFGDLGLSSTEWPSDTGDAVGQDNHGSKMYAAPEICQWSTDAQELPNNVTWAIDIWSLGCLFFETAVWMASYEQGRQEFRQARVSETETLGGLVQAGYRGAFHDGFKPLQALTEQITVLSRRDTPVARLSVKVMKFALNEMLAPQAGQRLRAEQLWERFRRIIKPSEPRSPVSPSIGHTTPITNAQAPNETKSRIDCGEMGISDEERKATPPHRDSHEPDIIDQIGRPGRHAGRRYSSEQAEWQKPPASPHPSSRKYPPPSFKTSESVKSVTYRGSLSASERSPPLTVAQVIEWIPRAKRHKESLYGMSATLETLRGRRQIFIADNSASMRGHWEPVKQTVRALAYLAKHMSPRGFDVHMTNNWVKARQKKTKGLFGDKGLFQKHYPHDDRGPCKMEIALERILLPALNEAVSIANRTETHSFRRSPWKHRGVQGIDVYILTNGVWEPSVLGRVDEAGGVEHPIKAAVTRLKELGFARTFLSIQFIRFGQDRDGMRRLGWLDDNIQDMVGWDIVDTTSQEGDVSKMLIGSKSERTDSQEDGSPCI